VPPGSRQQKRSSHPLTGITAESATEQALHSRSDLAAAEAALRAEKAERLPVVSLSANSGASGVNAGNFNQLYSISGDISVPVYTFGQLRWDVGRSTYSAGTPGGSSFEAG
jgi:outer membrane protein TolC